MVCEYIDWYLNNFYKVEHDPKAYDYVIHIPYETVEGLEQEVFWLTIGSVNNFVYRDRIHELSGKISVS